MNNIPTKKYGHPYKHNSYIELSSIRKFKRMTEFSAFLALFLSAFLAATLVQAKSELGLGYRVINTDYSMVLLVIVASLGNTIGAIINWPIEQGIANSCW